MNEQKFYGEHFETIKRFAEGLGLKVREPHPNCKRCYGRGYTAIDQEGNPIPCICIEDPVSMIKMSDPIIFYPKNRTGKRKMNRALKGAYRASVKEVRETLKNSDTNEE